jgi:peptidoglycan-N-acetylglucosamine deacetylase
MTVLAPVSLNSLGRGIRVPGPFHVPDGEGGVETTVRIVVTSSEVRERFIESTGIMPETFPLTLRILDLEVQPTDDVVVCAVETGAPLVVRRNGDLIVNFDVLATQAFRFADSKRPIYTYLPRFNIQKVPATIRRPLSNLLQSFHAPRRRDLAATYRRLPLTSFEFVLLLLHAVAAVHEAGEPHAFRWPGGRRAAFIALHDVDTGGFLRRQERDALFRLEQKHQMRSTWFIPTAILGPRPQVIDFLLRSGSEVGWHGYNHDHRLAFAPFAAQRVAIFNRSYFARPENSPTGMRTPKLLKSNHLYDLLDRSSPALRYDTSFLHGIVPYRLWINGRPSRILEIPTTVPTDIRLYNELRDLPRSQRPRAILDAQIARTKQLYEVGGLIAIVTHPEKDLSERPELLEVYDEYLSYVRSCPDIWFATASEVFTYWTGEGAI